MSILPGAVCDTPFYGYRATGDEVCERCLTLDGACFPVSVAAEIERGLSCSCAHVWDGYVLLNNSALTDHAKAGWELGLSASGVPCPSLCPPDLLALVYQLREARAKYEAEAAVINALCLGPDRDDIAPDEVLFWHNVKISEAEPYERARRERDRLRRAVWNYVENHLRDLHGLPHVGEGWVSEMRLFRIVQAIFPDDTVIHHYRAPWLGRLELDVYAVGADVGFEYQGIQHYEPVEHWGGAEALRRGRERDVEKARRCAEHGTRLIEVRFNEPLTEAAVREKLAR